MQITTLESTSLKELTDCFNLAFSDYVVPMQFSEEEIEEHNIQRGVDLNVSVGDFEDGKLVGLVFTGINGTKSYNGGTGVIPAMRGKSITRKLYEYLLPLLKERHIESNVLEVITENKPAIRVYQAIGYEIVRELNCYRGTLEINESINNYEIRPLEDYAWEVLTSFWDWKPSWQHSVNAMDNTTHGNIVLGVFEGRLLVGYLIYNIPTKKVLQFAVNRKFRRKGIGLMLFKYIMENYTTDIRIINVDDSDAGTNSFLGSIGLTCFLRQHEMLLSIH